MKIRNGFVSNSSSSSFIIDGTKYTCVDIAKSVAKTVYLKEWEDEDKYNKFIENLDKLENKDTPIYFILSDDGQIAKEGDKIYVDITRNYCWDFETYGRYYDEGEFYHILKKKYYYFPEFDNRNYLGKFIWYSEFPSKYKYRESDCKKCGTSYSWIQLKNGDVMCPKCGHDPDGKFLKRLEKLKRILDKDD